MPRKRLRRLLFRLGFVFQRALCLINNRFERGLVGNGEVRENLAVQADTGSFQSFSQSAVSHAVRACGSVETLDPKITKCALASFAVAIGPILGLHDRVFGVTKKFRTAAAVTLGFFQHSFPASTACRGICSSWHCCCAPGLVCGAPRSVSCCSVVDLSGLAH